MQTIRIVNPRPGGVHYTSIRAALKYVRRSWARMTPDNELFFFEGRRAKQEHRETFAEVVRESYAGMSFWNGDGDPLALHHPGEVRS